MRRIGVLVLLIVLVGISGLAQAQELPPVPCGNLAPEDCDILQQSRTAMASLTSGNMNLSFDLSFENLPEVAGGAPVTISLTGTGAFSGDLSAFLTPPPDAIMTDSAVYADYLQQTFDNLDAELSLNLSIPPELAQDADEPIPPQIPINLRLVDGVAYLDFDSLRAVAGEDAEDMPAGWGGLDLIELLTRLMEQGGAMGGMGVGGMNPQMFSGFSNPEFAGQHLLIERLADGTAADGAQVAVFSTTLDFAGLMSDPAIQEMMNQSLQMDGAELTDEQREMMEQMMPDMSAMFSQMFEGMNFSLTQSIGLQDFYVRNTTFTFSWDMSGFMNAMMGAFGQMGGMTVTGEPAAAQPPMIVRLNASLDFSNFNGGVQIAAPENATLTSVDELLAPMEAMQQFGDMEGDFTMPDIEIPTVELPTELATPMPAK